MASLSPTAAPVKAGHRRPGKVWHANVSNIVNGGAALRLTCTTGKKVEAKCYWLESVPADFGLGFRLTKWEVEEGEPAEYFVNVDPPHGHHECECLGHLRWGGKDGWCKHIRAVLKLLSEGRLPPPPCACGAPAVAGPQCLACHDSGADQAARRADCQLDDF
jgi:hypothetical protein